MQLQYILEEGVAVIVQFPVSFAEPFRIEIVVSHPFREVEYKAPLELHGTLCVSFERLQVIVLEPAAPSRNFTILCKSNTSLSAVTKWM